MKTTIEDSETRVATEHQKLRKVELDLESLKRILRHFIMNETSDLQRYRAASGENDYLTGRQYQLDRLINETLDIV